MELSTIVLIIVGVLAILAFIFIIVAADQSEKNVATMRVEIPSSDNTIDVSTIDLDVSGEKLTLHYNIKHTNFTSTFETLAKVETIKNRDESITVVSSDVMLYTVLECRNAHIAFSGAINAIDDKTYSINNRFIVISPRSHDFTNMSKFSGTLIITTPEHFEIVKENCNCYPIHGKYVNGKYVWNTKYINSRRGGDLLLHKDHTIQALSPTKGVVTYGDSSSRRVDGVYGLDYIKHTNDRITSTLQKEYEIYKNMRKYTLDDAGKLSHLLIIAHKLNIKLETKDTFEKLAHVLPTTHTTTGRHYDDKIYSDADYANYLLILIAANLYKVDLPNKRNISELDIYSFKDFKRHNTFGVLWAASVYFSLIGNKLFDHSYLNGEENIWENLPGQCDTLAALFE